LSSPVLILTTGPNPESRTLPASIRWVDTF
jgi:hypothetical protein